MDARIIRTVCLTAALVVSMGARHRSANFIVETPDANLAAQIAQAAEKYRHDLAVEWLGQPMPDWSQPCPMTVMVGPNLGAGGATTFVFDRGEVFGWRMTIQGSGERILDSVLPHEITHMIYASRFRRPLPRWADEGGATTVENIAERSKYQRMLDQFLRTGRGIAFNRMFAMTDYPPAQEVMPLYAECYSLAEYLIQIGGRRKYVEFLGDGLKSGNWTAAVASNYGIGDLGRLQNSWLAWVKQGSPAINPGNNRPAAGASPEMLAANSGGRNTGPGSMYGQSAANRSTQSTVIPAGSLTPVPGLAFNSATPAAASASASVSSRAGVRLASATAELPSSGWKTAGMRQSTPKSTPALTPEPAAMARISAVQPEQTAVQHDGTAFPQSQPPRLPQPPQADPFQSVARPQDAELPRQVILEWSAR
jgi:hypothetical protein